MTQQARRVAVKRMPGLVRTTTLQRVGIRRLTVRLVFGVPVRRTATCSWGRLICLPILHHWLASRIWSPNGFAGSVNMGRSTYRHSIFASPLDRRLSPNGAVESLRANSASQRVGPRRPPASFGDRSCVVYEKVVAAAVFPHSSRHRQAQRGSRVALLPSRTR